MKEFRHKWYKERANETFLASFCKVDWVEGNKILGDRCLYEIRDGVLCLIEELPPTAHSRER